MGLKNRNGEEIEPTTHTYLKGYWEALDDFGIWENGERVIGCLQTPIKEAMQMKLNIFNVDLIAFRDSL
jgi:hypothetical protein